ncbi:uncharacterized protein LOC121370387 isoform X2 [Gigantopelta aegis]|uniref:uncharacterized protein LOC121370387 isoform X2 n=1 Tax=Gigantopelta aegis TaxID=1735272 RepID=UPI001B88BD6C|nr:uncharacterized protein LOC121370387 isoform X2 [Gigantopelta aegis]
MNCDLVRHSTDGEYESDLSAIIQNGESAIQDILTRINSLPPSQEWIGLELTLVYNLICFQLLLGNLRKFDWLAVLKRSTNLLKHSLNRVKTALKVASSVSSIPESDDGVVELIEELVNVKHLLRVHNVVDSFSLVSCIHTLVLMHYGNLPCALSCLEALKPLVIYDTDLLKLHPQMGMLAFSPNCIEEGMTTVNSLRLTDVINFCMGVCCYKLKQGPKCRSVLIKINYRPWKLHATYLIGSSLFSEQLYREAMNYVNVALNEDTDSDTEAELRARLFSLQGICFYKLNFHHSAIAAFKEALQLDFTSHDALYNIALQYRHLGLLDEELEALNLLVTILQDRPSSQFDSTKICFNSLFTSLFTGSSLSTSQVLYALASRCKQLNRFTEASEKYLDLLQEESEFSSLCLQGNETLLEKLPDMATVFTECAYCLLKCDQFQECIVICSRALEVYSSAVFRDESTLGRSDPLDDDDDDDDADGDLTVLLSGGNGSQSRKRRRSESGDLAETPSWKQVETHMTLVFYKADALVQCEDLKSAADVLHRSIEHFQEYCEQILATKEIMSSDQHHHTSEVGSAAKKQRTNDGQIVNTAQNNKNQDTQTIPRKWQHLLSEACTHLAAIFLKMDSTSDALHYCRLSIQLDVENTKAWYICCLVLQKNGRQYESVSSWLQHRQICHKSDSFHLTNELKRKRENLRMLTTGDSEKKPILLCDPISSCEFLKMDISSLEHLLKYQQSKQFSH